MGGYFSALVGEVQSNRDGKGNPQAVTFTLTSADLLSIGTTPFQVLPAPGPNKSFLPIASMAHYKFGSTAYTVGGGGAGELDFAFTSDDTEPLWVAFPLTGFVDQTKDMFGQGTANLTAMDTAHTVDLPLLATTGGTALTLGDGTIDVTLHYYILDFA